MIDTVQAVLAALSGTAVGFTLGLVGGGGSILAVPLMVYVVGVKSPHLAIGTSALAVAANALAGLGNHARAHNVNWRCGGTYALAGVLGAFAGSSLGKAVDGQKLLFLFALLMLVVAGLMFRGRGDTGVEGVVCNRDNFPKVASFGFGTGTLSASPLPSGRARSWSMWRRFLKAGWLPGSPTMGRPARKTSMSYRPRSPDTWSGLSWRPVTRLRAARWSRG